MKQVPAGTKVDIDPETGAMKRLSGETRTNPYDLFALEAALQLREKVGGSVTVLTMGPPQAEEMMRDAYTMGQMMQSFYLTASLQEQTCLQHLMHYLRESLRSEI